MIVTSGVWNAPSGGTGTLVPFTLTMVTPGVTVGAGSGGAIKGRSVRTPEVSLPVNVLVPEFSRI